MVTSYKNAFSWINRDGKLIIISKGITMFARSFLAVMLALYLDKLGFPLIQIGAFLSITAAGSAFFTFLVSLISERVGRRRFLVLFTLISSLAGLALVFITDFLPLMFVAFLGGIPGEMGSPSLPLEQAALSDTADDEKRTDLFALYRIVSIGGAALGALAVALPSLYQNTFGVNEIDSYKIMLVSFSFFLVVGALLFRLLSSAIEYGERKQSWVNPLKLPSRRYIFTLTGLFSLDSFAGFLFPQTLAAYWFYTRFGVGLESLSLVFFLAQLLAAVSQWVAAKLANRIGLINTMVFTHIPASLFLVGAAFAPNLWIAVIFWQLRAFCSRMDVPTRDSYTMSVVQPQERVAIAGYNAMGRHITGSFAPTIAAALWQVFSATVPLISSAVLKISYDISLYFMFRNVKPPQEMEKE